jgi:CO/xanthine dehydrogenase Mo-binding subunit
MNGIHSVGKPARRVDALNKVLGKTKYIGDFQLPNMLYARALRSDVPHARIVHLDISPAIKVPGVCAVITGEDFIDHGVFGNPYKDQHLLAFQQVRHVGEGIAAVAAETPEAALAGVRAIICELEPLPPIFDMELALEPDAPQLGPNKSDGTHPNLVTHNFVQCGDPVEELKLSAFTLERNYHVGHQDHAYLETEGALAIPNSDGGVMIYATDQNPFINKSILVKALGLPEIKVRVIQPPVGGSFGGKNDLSYQAAGQVAALALKTGRPVKMTFSREESAIAGYMRDAMNMRIQLGADSEGKLRACKFDATLDSGAYPSGSYLTTWRAAMHAMGAYRYKACHVDIRSVYTSNGFSGAFRGFGNTEVCYAIEQAIDEMAEIMKMDPIDFRLNNCLQEGDMIPHGQRLEDSVGLVECIQKVRQLSGWDHKRREYPQQNASSQIHHGIGVACCFHGVSLGAEGADNASCTLRINDDHTLSLTSGLTDYGQGAHTVFTLIAAEELGIRPARIHMLQPDTDTAINSGPTVASRATVVGGNASRLAARNIARLLELAAADLLHSSILQLGRSGEDFLGPDEEPVSWDTVVDHARTMGLILSTQSRWDAPEIDWDFKKGQGKPYFAYHFGAQVAEVDVDIATGKTDVVGIWAAHDSGQVIFPQGAYGQLYGGIAQGLGYALLERCDYDQGYLQNLNYDDYLIPTSLDVPDITATFVLTHSDIGPYGAKNIAEPAMVSTAPAILNAISHATGRRIRDLPANLERVLLGHDLRKPGESDACKKGLLL